MCETTLTRLHGLVDGPQTQAANTRISCTEHQVPL